jgi:hypothetical protein
VDIEADDLAKAARSRERPISRAAAEVETRISRQSPVQEALLEIGQPH